MRRLAYAAAGVAAVTAVLAVFHGPVFSWVQHFFGFENGAGNGSHYLFWSGAGSDLAYLSVLATAAVYYRKENCKYRWCPFLGHYEFTNPDTGVTRKLCAIHHPDVHHKTLSREHLRDVQRTRHLYFGKHPGKG